jgi:deoxyribose-phosphate aldolase
MTLSADRRAAISSRALPLVDLTNLADTCTSDDVRELWHQASTPFGMVAAVCVWPRFVGVARDQRRNDPEDARAGAILIATVVNFPSGNEPPREVAGAARSAVQAGADEIDLVLPYRALLAGDRASAGDMVERVRESVGSEVTLKVILETGALDSASAIGDASRIAIAAGADFIKTSTGRTAPSATPEAARTMLEAIRESGRPVGLKPSGGIRTVEDAAVYLDLAGEIMGADWAAPRTFRFGASGLLSDLVAAIARRPAGSQSGH